jgi:hypothetical protein
MRGASEVTRAMQPTDTRLRFGRMGRRLIAAAAAAALALGMAASGATVTMKYVPEYARFEQTLRSPLAYTNPLEQVEITAIFTSPVGDVKRVRGFWDAGRIWRVRFSPDTLGLWSFVITNSDPANGGLNADGQFLCGAPIGRSRFGLHGPVSVALDHRHFAQADDTPFFWLADTLWAGSAKATKEDWDYYTQVRLRQGFTVVQWCAEPNADEQGRRAFSEKRPLQPDARYFKEMDTRIDLMNRAGLLSAIVPLRELSLRGIPQDTPGAEHKAILQIQYMVARWGASDIAWVLTCEGGSLGRDVERWKRIGRAVFGNISHGPVAIYAGENDWVLDEFRQENWVDFLCCRTSQENGDDAMQWLIEGAVSKDWLKDPPRPMIVTAPFEDEAAPQSHRRAEDADVRRTMYWSLLGAPPAGVSYGAHGVWNWTTNTTGSESATDDAVVNWRPALFMPAARQAGTMAAVFEGLNYWDLRPAPDVIARQPGFEAPSRHIAAARSKDGDMVLVYVPEDRNVELVLDQLPKSPTVTWINPRTGARSTGMAAYGSQTGQFPTPGPGDWLLLITGSPR